ncbi:UNVERIFIED_ORG: hypothetical protein ABID33_001904 [Xanthobacter viscosus]|jgi:hypothetical protein|uniref:DUF1254 domain-containing protein n=1 Tax=Xanthobacter autotrophicus TaxID=280 RepID=A0A6C1KHS2_XANAU|nr:DUF1254 domain-containing protein [Xanthobacter autotrophicus]TLX42674.1 DUF1254 domain-containing protein [Xanthobacter autotrophicus]
MLSKRHFLKILAAGGLSAPALVPGLSWAASPPDRPGFFKAKDIAEAAFIYGLPMVMNYGVMYEYVVDRNSGQFKAPFNEIYNEARVFTYQDTSVPTPNSDTPYSLAWLDLRAEPVVISVPAVDPKRYYSVQLVDGNTFNYGYIGSRSTGNDAGDFLVVGPRWTGETPPGIRKVFRATTDFALTIFRTQLFDAADIDNVKKVQAGYQLRPLSTFLGKAAPPAAPVPDFPKFTKDLARTEFFEFLDFALQFAPALPEEREIRAQLATIGVGPGKSFDFKTLSLEDKAEVLLGLKEGQRKVTEAVAAFGTNFNGWRVGSIAGDADFFKQDWLLRAVGAQAGIYGNDAVEATYPMTRLDADGQTLDGSKHNYTLTFPADGLPPVNAFWSVTMYDGVNQLLIKNPIDRYLVNSPMLPNLKRNADGSITLYIQNKSPGPDKESNWLPAPDGPIYLVMRLYWPKEAPPSILPAGKGTWQPPGIRKA